MNSILLANSSPDESARLAKIINTDYTVTCTSAPDIAKNEIDKVDLILLSHNFTESSGIDFLMRITKESFVPVLIITPLTDPQCAIEALRSGAYNYIVETEGYEQILSIAIQEAIIHFNEREEMKQTIFQLRNKVEKMEIQYGVKPPPAKVVVTSKKQTQPTRFPETPKKQTQPAKFTETPKKQAQPAKFTETPKKQAQPAKFTETPKKQASPVSQVSTKEYMIQEIISRFKRGDINLPPVPGVINKFNETIRSGASIPKLAEILRKDVGISTKLINVSNSTYYRGISENKNLEDAINRLGLRETRQYVYAIANRNLYTSSNKTYAPYFEKLWNHSLACAYGVQATCNILEIEFKEDPFTLGLLHDVGILILLEIISELSLKEEGFQEINSEAMYSTIIQLHDKFGAVLLKRWNFQPVFIEVAMHHHNPEKAKTITKEILVVNLANMIAKKAGYLVGPEEETDILASQSAALLKITDDHVAKITSMVEEQIKAFSSILTN